MYDATRRVEDRNVIVPHSNRLKTHKNGWYKYDHRVMPYLWDVG